MSKNKELQSKIQLKIDIENENIYKKDANKRHKTSHEMKILILLIVIVVVLLIVSMCLIPYGALSFLYGGNIGYTMASYRAVTMTRIADLWSFITGAGGESAQFIIYTFVALLLGGMALAASGAVSQGVFQNPMASPTTMGVQSGGMLFGIIYTLCFMTTNATNTVNSTLGNDLIKEYFSMSIFERMSQELFILAGSIVGVILIVTISMIAGKGKINTVALMLTGSVFSMLINQFAQLVQYILQEQNAADSKIAVVNSLMGASFSGESISWYELLMLSVPIIVCLGIMFGLTNKINIMVFGADEAKAMGINVTAFRNVLIIAITILTATVMAFLGQIALLGFMMPHLARYLVGPDYRYLVPASALLGGICLVLIYDVMYVTGATSMLNVATSIVCSILTMIFMLKYRRNRNADWA